MIAIDTNVLLRHVLQDDEQQSPLATRLIEQHDKVLVTDVVLIETVWTLSGKKYQASRDDIIKMISDLLGEPNIVFENPHVVWAALSEFRTERPTHDETGRKLRLPDFADALIIYKAKQTAKQWDEVLEAVFSFDSGALRVGGTRHP